METTVEESEAEEEALEGGDEADGEEAEEEVEADGEEAEEEVEAEVEAEAEEEAEEAELTPFEYRGATYYRDAENNVYMTDEDGEPVDEPIGTWNELKQRIIVAKKPAA